MDKKEKSGCFDQSKLIQKCSKVIKDKENLRRHRLLLVLEQNLERKKTKKLKCCYFVIFWSFFKLTRMHFWTMKITCSGALIRPGCRAKLLMPPKAGIFENIKVESFIFERYLDL